MLFTGALFGFIHGSVIQFLVICTVGIILALTMLKTGQLWTVIAAHGLYNLVGTSPLKFDLPELRATPVLGVSGLVVAAAAFWIAVRWLGLSKENEKTEKKSIWTVSLVIVVVLASISVIVTTHTALGPGTKAAL